jgi:two-component sensor histidine kinase
MTLFHRATGKLEPWHSTDGMRLNRANAIQEDNAGQLWIGLYNDGQLLRRRGNWIDHFGEADGVPTGRIHALHLDSTGRLWIASGDGGLACVDHPEALRPLFRRYTVREGLSTDLLYSLAEDNFGRIYVGSSHGVDRLDPATSQVKQYSVNDGLLQGEAHIAFQDRHGAIWIGTSYGVSRLVPTRDIVPSHQAVRVLGIRVGTRALPIDPAGIATLNLPEFHTGTDTLQFEYGSPRFSTDPVWYRFRLDGAGGAWSAPTRQRSVLYAGLSPGNYRFVVESVGEPEGRASAWASVAFAIAPPWWMRWWSLAFASLTAVGLVSMAYRYRVDRLLELEHVRMRIASDLHDDIGSGLSHIAILSELAQRKQESIPDSLPRIAELSRELVESMGDIVWSVNPRNDYAGVLTQRMRRFAVGLLEASGIEFHFEVDGPAPGRRLQTDSRRQVYLIFKECVHNAARHSRATKVTASLREGDGQLVLEVWDNGRGIPPDAAESGGNGLVTMRARAASIGGELRIENRDGTTIELRVPLRR